MGVEGNFGAPLRGAKLPLHSLRVSSPRAACPGGASGAPTMREAAPGGPPYTGKGNFARALTRAKLPLPGYEPGAAGAEGQGWARGARRGARSARRGVTPAGGGGDQTRPRGSTGRVGAGPDVRASPEKRPGSTLTGAATP
jgi:hypothetical protein